MNWLNDGGYAVFCKRSYVCFFLLITVFMCIPMVCSAAVIQPSGSGTGWSWSGTTELQITSSGSYTFAPGVNFPKTIVYVEADNVSIDGRNVIFAKINGRPTLDLSYITNVNSLRSFIKK